MPETLLTQSSIKLFGRLMNDVQYVYDQNTLVRGANNFLQSQFAASPSPATPVSVTGTTTTSTMAVTSVSSLTGLVPGMTVTASSGGNPVFQTSTVIVSIGPGSQFTVSAVPAQAVSGATISAQLSNAVGFARIYAFSFEGALYTLPKPSIFLVHGIGFPVDPPGNGTRTTLDQSGVIAREWEFAAAVGGLGNRDLRYWEYEKGDFSLRLDTEAGPFEQILLAAALRSGADRADRSGQGLDVRSGQGLDVRSGQGLRTGR